ncbi:MAG: transposon-transfer assisting family protein [Christensenellales bacterium]|jgi:hypothetical protein
MKGEKTMPFTFDEQNLLAIYSVQASNRTEAIQALEEVLPHLEADETELRKLCQLVIGKLHAMTDKEYLALDLTPGI